MFFVMLAQAEFPPLYLLLLVTPIVSVLTSFFVPIFIVLAIFLVIFLVKQKFPTHLIIGVLILNLFFLFITPVLWGQLKGYQQNRILTFLEPTRDPLNTGYQVIQARIAVGSGQVFGKGFLEGTQKNMNFLPEHHTDFIFSVISEEFGFVGSLSLIFAFIVLFSRIVRNIFRSEVRERRIAMSGVLGYMFFQVLINIGMNVGLMPTTGIPLPFISYGGSSLVMNSVAIALVLKYGGEKEL
jgi:rod shape determining protein RodA